MPLPEQVIQQLGREPARTPGWAFGVVMFAGGFLFLIVMIYVGLIFGYEPYLAGQIQQKEDQINSLAQSVSLSDQTKLLNFYSQISNLKTLLHGHIFSSQLLTWLQNNTQSNVTYQSLAFAQGNQLLLTAVGKSQTDVNQQIAIFESSPQVQQVNIASVGAASQISGWEFTATVIFNPSILTYGGLNPPAAAATATTTTQ